MKEYGFNTTLLHGTEGNNPHGATQVPIYHSRFSVVIAGNAYDLLWR